MTRPIWKQDKRWVYSITYDEGCAALLEHALPLHRKYGIPGHVALVASQIGVPRNVPGSSYNGMQILSADEIRMLVGEGWGVSCHGLTHAAIDADNLQEELYRSRCVLEDTLGLPVRMFCLPGNNNHHAIVADHAVDAGYQAVLTIYDDINRPDVDLLRLCRCPVHVEYPPPFYSAFDPYKRLHQAADACGWVVDYCHCPLPGKAVHPRKDCTLEQLEERFRTVIRVGAGEVWLAEPNQVAAHLLQKRKQG